MTLNDSFGGWLRRRRKALDLTQTELADRVGCAVVTIQKFERNIARPSKHMSERLADVLAIAPDERGSFLAFARQSGDDPPALPVSSAPHRPSDHLPAPPTPFVGRVSELEQIADRLDNPGCRLLTLVGEGGIGKTRLAIQAARQHSAAYSDGAHFVSLVSVRSPDMLTLAIGSVLGVSAHRGGPPLVQLLNYLRTKTLLLVLDNFEHVLVSTPQLTELLMAAPDLRILVTSREPLKLPEEWVIQIHGMDYPEVRSAADETIENYSAVQLFAQSARRVHARFSVNDDPTGVLRICQLVEGIPLAIVLAAAWVELLTLSEIAHEIQTREL